MALKEIKTGYFAKTKVYSDNGYRPYSISRITPKGCKCGEIKDLAPSWELLKGYKNGMITSGDYTSKYWQMLSSKDVEILIMRNTNKEDIQKDKEINKDEDKDEYEQIELDL